MKVFEYFLITLASFKGCECFRNDTMRGFYNALDGLSEQRCKDKPYGYKIADETDCFGYFICHGEEVIQQYCPHGHRFYAASRSCQIGKCPPCMGTCDIDCSSEPDGTRFLDCNHCRFFWQCVSGSAVRLFCERENDTEI
ncbi:unnamed protein product [Ceratitis capitata]|uniref:(Mediterranean fruit fly) hypothetical protein n=1 Tax=Ceratitis capitata TaxID=7213 RepID=A0A811V0R5_CERCA|nr:unnamed protein product [Ceratitis capitata]